MAHLSLAIPLHQSSTCEPFQTISSNSADFFEASKLKNYRIPHLTLSVGCITGACLLIGTSNIY
ncbi:hypothetical protein M758_3G163300 [Ceratodon purpureus]|uniref:Uncharacterized protein n=1 Tax=Ceratodon purpureus TaxID=3225 RepID=A0A8T0IL98_CERPU|nr:hypothetical protein KC19_3G163800 [Ceratodon purpureus]KAG0623292.1 hypothetical protein M758_3G163300 [Ceratodon purpureus]